MPKQQSQLKELFYYLLVIFCSGLPVEGVDDDWPRPPDWSWFCPLACDAPAVALAPFRHPGPLVDIAAGSYYLRPHGCSQMIVGCCEGGASRIILRGSVHNTK